MKPFTLHFFLWGYLAAYCLHIVEESTVRGRFVEMMKRDYWPEYDGTKFFGYNRIAGEISTSIWLISAMVDTLITLSMFGSTWLMRWKSLAKHT